MVRRRRLEPSSAVPEHLRPGSSLQRASVDEWVRQRIAFMDEDLEAAGTNPAAWVIETVETMNAARRG